MAVLKGPSTAANQTYPFLVHLFLSISRIIDSQLENPGGLLIIDFYQWETNYKLG